MQILKINILIFNFYVFYMFQTRGIKLKEDGCIRSYDMVRFACWNYNKINTI
jgi:hypothetical protein